MSYKNNSLYIVVPGTDYGYCKEHDIVAMYGYESCSDTARFSVFRDGECLFEHVEEDDENSFTIIDALFYLKHGIPEGSDVKMEQIEAAIAREYYHEGKIPEIIKQLTSK